MKILCLVVCAVFAAALPARAQSDEYRDAVAEMMELTGALRNADVVMTRWSGTSKPPPRRFGSRLGEDNLEIQ